MGSGRPDPRAVGCGRFAGCANARDRLRQRDLSLVQRRPTDPVVESRSPHDARAACLQASSVATQEARRVPCQCGLPDPHRPRLRSSHSCLCPGASRRSVGHLDRRGNDRRLCRAASHRPRAQRGDVDRRRTGGRAVLRGAGKGGLRRVDVHAPRRCIEDGIGGAGRVVSSTGCGTRRLPAEHGASRESRGQRDLPRRAGRPRRPCTRRDTGRMAFRPVYWSELLHGPAASSK
jgi:hypothetical protein